MISILTFLTRYCGYLFERPGFRFADSSTGANDFYGSSVLLVSKDVEIFVTNERSEMIWQIRSVHDPRKYAWFSFDLVAQLLSYPVTGALMNSENCNFMKEALPSVLERFEKGKVSRTLKELEVLQRKREKTRWKRPKG